MNSSTWQAIRALRAAPIHAAASDPDRRRTFSASLRQAEELAAAAQAVGYAAMPIPLFYSLSQAGRAISAAYLPAPWNLDGHGLQVTRDAEKSLLERSVKPERSKKVDSFRGVAAAVDSPMLNGSAQLGTLWAANPDLLDVPIPAGSGNWLPAIEIPIGSQSIPMMVSESERDPEQHFITTDGTIGMSVNLHGETGAKIAATLKSYPTLRKAFGVTQGLTGTKRAGPDDRVIRGMGHNREVASIAVDAPHQLNFADYWSRQRSFASIVEIDKSQPTYPSPSYVGFALPEIAGRSSPLPLLLWWALLLGLSSLARYEPAVWTAAIDLDASELAVALERVLDVARERVPARILQSLQQGTVGTHTDSPATR